MTVDLHTHTLASGHAFNTIDELAAGAAQAGIELLGISDHGPSMEGASKAGYFEMAQRVPKRIGATGVWFGCEANITDLKGRLDLPDATIRGLDFLMAGLHARTPFPRSESAATNTRAIVACIRRYRPLAITHPFTLEFPTIVEEIAQAAADYDVAVEVNLARIRARISARGNACAELTHTRNMLAAAEGCNAAVIIGSDAHHRSELGSTPAELDHLSGILEFDLGRAINFSTERWNLNV